MMNSLRLIAVGMICAGAALGAGAVEQRARTGNAYDVQSGGLIYVQRHVETVVDGRVVRDDVTYLDASGKAFAHKQVEFGAQPHVPEFTLDDERSGHFEAVRRVEDGLIEVQYRERAGEPLRSARLAIPDDALVDAGFDRFIEEHWGELLAGATFVRSFLVPSRLEFMDFRIRRGASRDSAGTVGFLLEVDSVLLRLLVDPITAVYDASTRRLARYEGLSNLRGAKGDNLRVRIRFEYATRVVGNPQCDAAVASTCVQ